MKKRAPIFIFTVITSLLAFYLLNRATFIYNTLAGAGDILTKVTKTIDMVVPSIKQNIFMLDTTKNSLYIACAGMIGVWLVFLYHAFDNKKYMPGIEHGSAEWGTSADIVNFIDREYSNNILLTATEKLSMNNRMKRTKHDDYNRNKNVLVVGGAGSGKTRFYVKPNIMQMHSSYVITDPKGSLLTETGTMLQDNGYTIKVFDLINRSKSDKYNPFEYIRNEDDILKLINNLITNTESMQNKNAGDFWEKSERALLQAIFGYLYYESPKVDQHMGTVMNMMRLAEVKEDNEDHKSPLDILFDDLENKTPDHFAVKQYKIFKYASAKTAKSILISVGVRLAPFNIKSISDMVAYDQMELDMVGCRKTALFIILPDTDTSYNFLAAMMFQQLFDSLIYKADNEYQGSLPFHVRFMLDEFANIGQIPMFEILIATMRSREMSANIILQNLAQIKNLYKETWEIITGNCDSFLYLGGLEQSTNEYVSKLVGKTTIDNINISENKGSTGSYSENSQILGRDLITPDEVGKMKGGECILKIRGCKPYKSLKFDIEKHKNYKYLSDFSPENAFTYNMRKENGFFSDIKRISKIEKIIDLSELNIFSKQ